MNIRGIFSGVFRPPPSSGAPPRPASPAVPTSMAPRDVFVPARPAAAFGAAAPADRLPRYAELTDRRRALLGPGGATLWASLPERRKAAFLLVTARLDRNAVDVSGLRVKGGASGIEQGQLLFDGPPEALARFRASIERGIAASRFKPEKPQEFLHPGSAEFGVRENRATYSLQIGVGRGGAFVDIDHHNPHHGVGQAILHFFRDICGRPIPMDPFKVARELGEDLSPREPSA